MYRRIKRRSNGSPPYGYNIDGDYLEPDVEALTDLETVIEYVEARAISLRRASEYLEQCTNRALSYEGLRLIIKNKTHPIYTDATEE